VECYISFPFYIFMRIWQGMAIATALQALPFYALHAATPETAIWPFQGWLPTGRAACGHILPPWTPHVVRLRAFPVILNPT
jgi:hypothetical protein